MVLIDSGPGSADPTTRGGKMKTKIQFETRNPLPEQAGITKIKELSYLASFPAYFKYECSPEWAQGKDITVEQVAIFWEGIFIAGKSERDTLGVKISI
jgi:hypothetical protein